MCLLIVLQFLALISIHALLAESDALIDRFAIKDKKFQSTLSLRRATAVNLRFTGMEQISIHALLAESDRSSFSMGTLLSQFQSTLSLRRATLVRHCRPTTRAISIHALLAESDFSRQYQGNGFTQFQSTLSLRRATAAFPSFYKGMERFQSTLSLRRATGTCIMCAWIAPDFNPRSPCGERPTIIRFCLSLSRISIHALLAESDEITDTYRGKYQDFNPRSPCGERLAVFLVALSTMIPFQSTLSLRRATLEL